ncbi:unnamed protein product, partial [Staurois parvus]
GVFTTRQTRHLLRVAFFRGAAPLPGRRNRRRGPCGMGTRWDPREAADCLKVYEEPQRLSFQGMSGPVKVGTCEGGVRCMEGGGRAAEWRVVVVEGFLGWG